MAGRIRQALEKVMTIFANEIHNYVFAPGFYAVAIPYLLIPSYLYFRQAFLSSYADLRPLFDILPWALIIFVPALTMRHLTEERRRGLYELAISNPISEEALVFGKFLSITAILIVVNALFLLIPAIASPFANFDYGKIVSQYIGVSFLGAFIAAFSLAVTAFTLNQYAAFLVSSAGTLVLYLFSSSFVLLAFPAKIRLVLEFLSPITHYLNFAKGVIDFSSVAYFSFFVWFFLYVSSLKLKSVYAVRRDFKNQYLLLWLLLLLSLVSGLFLSSKVAFRLDLTREKLYTLSASTKEILSAIDSKIVVKVFASKELPPEISSVYRDVRDLLSEYKKFSRGKMEITFAQPDVNPKAKIEASNYGIPPIQFNVISNEEYRVKEGYFGIAVLYGGNHDTIPVITGSGDFELKLTSAIYNVTNKKRKKIGIISDSGAKNQYSGIAILANILQKQYEVEEVFASRREYKLENYDVLLLVGPLNPLESTSVVRIKEYLKNGGSLFLAADMVRVNPQSMSGENSNLNVNEITGPLGITLDYNIVMDLKNFENAVVGGENSYVIPYPFWIRPIIESNNVARALASTYKRLVLMWPSSVEIHEQKGYTYYPLLATSELAAEQANYYMLEPDQNFEAYVGRSRKYVLAVASEKIQDGRKARIAVIGDSDFIDDAVVQQNQENVGFALSLINWLARNEVLLGLKQKNLKPEAFSFPSKAVKEGVRYLTMSLMLILTILLGLIYRYLHFKSLRERYVSQKAN